MTSVPAVYSTFGLGNVVPVNLPGWTRVAEITPMVCAVCEQSSAFGYLHLTAAYAIRYICDDCATDLLNVYITAAGDTLIRQPAAGDVALQVFFEPGGDPKLAEVIVTPEPASAEAMIDLVEAAAVRLADYVTEYSAALHDDEPAVDRGQ